MAMVGESLTMSPLPIGFVISDHIWLVYKNETERDRYLALMEDIWEKVLNGKRSLLVSNIPIDE